MFTTHTFCGLTIKKEKKTCHCNSRAHFDKMRRVKKPLTKGEHLSCQPCCRLLNPQMAHDTEEISFIGTMTNVLEVIGKHFPNTANLKIMLPLPMNFSFNSELVHCVYPGFIRLKIIFYSRKMMCF